jgi:hypothetical protein
MATACLFPLASLTMVVFDHNHTEISRIALPDSSYLDAHAIRYWPELIRFILVDFPFSRRSINWTFTILVKVANRDRCDEAIPFITTLINKAIRKPGNIRPILPRDTAFRGR